MTNTIEAIRESYENGNTSLAEAIQAAIEQARADCEAKGSSSSDCAVAWDIVEELQAEQSHRQYVNKPKNSLDSYCETHPEAVECLIYDL